jgi:hypothetical protein
MIYLFRKTVYNCRQATLLSIKKAEGKITAIETMKLRYHLLFCDPCRRFIEQWDTLEKKDVTPAESPIYKLSDESRTRIQRRIEEISM